MASFLTDRSFLLKVNRHKVKQYLAAIMCLDFETEKPLARFEGKVISGSLSVAANSPCRRTGSMSIVFDKDTYNISDVLNLIAIDKKITLSLGIANPYYHTDQYRQYGEVLWFKQGVFAITSAQSSVSTSACTVSINIQDKMSFLNGTCGGTFPATTSLHDRIIIDGDENVTTEYPLISQIIKEVVHHFGGEHFSKINVEDVPDVGRIVVQYEGSTPINFSTIPIKPTGAQGVDDDTKNYQRTTGASFVIGSPPIEGFEDVYVKGDNVGYKETPLTYPGELIQKAGSTVTNALDEIVKALGGNYEYFYDVEGIFHFKKKNNFLATGNTPLNLSPAEDAALQELYCPRYSPTILMNEFLDAELVTNISFSPNYSNIKNDFVYWGNRQDAAKNEIMVRYHMAIDKRPEDIPLPVTDDEKLSVGENYSLCHKTLWEVRRVDDNTIVRYDTRRPDEAAGIEKGIKISSLNDAFPDNPDAWFNWREELYRRALVNYGASTEGSYYDEELMAEWRGIFDPDSTAQEKGTDSFEHGWNAKFGGAVPWTGYIVDAVTNPEKLRYWLDLVDTTTAMGKYSVARIGRRSVITEDSKINEVFAREINDIVFIEAPTNETEWEKAMEKVKKEYIPIGQSYSFIQADLWSYFKEKNSYGTCYEGVRSQLYQNLFYNSSVNITCIPIYYLDVNQCIRLNFPDRGVTGDYVINSISFQIGSNSTMTLQCQEAMVVV